MINTICKRVRRGHNAEVTHCGIPKRLCRAGRTSCASAKLSSSGSMASVNILSSTSPLQSTEAEQVSDLSTDSKAVDFVGSTA